MTAAEAMKQLKQLQLKRKQILDEENETSKFIAAVTEDIDAVRPEYNFQFTKMDLDVVENNIRYLKHQLNVFNSTYMIPELGMTIDQVLVTMPMLSEEVNKLRKMSGAIEKKRCQVYGGRTAVIEYEYTNYDRNEVREEYEKESKRLSDMQIALDKANTTVDIL